MTIVAKWNIYSNSTEEQGPSVGKGDSDSKGCFRLARFGTVPQVVRGSVSSRQLGKLVRRCMMSLLVQEAFPSGGYAAGGTRHRLTRRMRARAAQLRAVKSFLGSVIVEPVLAGLEAIDDGVAVVALCLDACWLGELSQQPM